MPRYRKREPYHFGIDYFKSYICQDKYKKSSLFGLSANSNFKMYDKQTIIKLLPGMGGKKYSKYFEIIDKETGVNLAFILLGKRDKIGAVERRDIFEVSGQGLILRSIPWYLKLIDVLGFYIDAFIRVDICLDITINTDYCIKNIFLPNVEKMTYLPHVKKGKYTGLDIGEKNPRQNTWKFIRVYNKILDTQLKEKGFLYDFKKNGIVDLTRVEIELRRDKCKHFHLEYLTNMDKLYDIFKYEVFGLNLQFFKFIHKEDVRKVIDSYFVDIFKDDEGLNLTKGISKTKLMAKKLQIIEYGGEFKNEVDKKRCLSMFATYTKKLLANGFTKQQILDNIDIITYNYRQSKTDETIMKIKNRLKECFLNQSHF